MVAAAAPLNAPLSSLRCSGGCALLVSLQGGGEGRGGCVEPPAEHEIGLKSNNTLHFTDALYAEDSNLSLPHWHSSDGFLSPSPTLLRPFTLWITQTDCFRCTFELLSYPTWDQNVTAVSSSFASECRCLLSAAEACPHTVSVGVLWHFLQYC